MHTSRDNETGVGTLRTIDGSSILDKASYNLTIEHPRIAGGLPRIHGEILNPPDGGFPAEALGEALLYLDDGREWECRLTDRRGTLGPR